MRTQVDRARRTWRRTIWHLRIVLFSVVPIIAYISWKDHAEANSFNWTNVWAGFGFLVGIGMLYLFMRLIYKFLLRFAEHRDRQSP